jgi:hypothetical protein
VGHRGRRSEGSNEGFWPSNIPPLWGDHYSCFVRPNAHCPVCGATVFYYCNSYGSSVYFDELGPPWPKHFCTDNPPNRNNSVIELSTLSNAENSYAWQKEGWEPCLLSLIQRIDSNTIRISLKQLKTGTQKEYYAKIPKIRLAGDDSSITRYSLAFFKYFTNNSVKISLLDNKGDVRDFTGWEHIFDLRRR